MPLLRLASGGSSLYLTAPAGVQGLAASLSSIKMPLAASSGRATELTFLRGVT